MSWRDEARIIIARVLNETRGQDEKAIKKALFDAYPFGPRENWPYKVWCDEVSMQRFGRKQIGPRAKPTHLPRFLCAACPDPLNPSMHHHVNGAKEHTA